MLEAYYGEWNKQYSPEFVAHSLDEFVWVG